LQDHLESLVLRMRKGGIRYSEALREFQKIFVLTVLREQKWNQVRAAETLDVHRNTLRRLIHQFQLDKVLTHDASSAARERASSTPGQERTCDVGVLCSSTLTDQDQVGRGSGRFLLAKGALPTRPLRW
jgi:hypothetical protein